jgi:SAM-dependent methyltransferase
MNFFTRRKLSAKAKFNTYYFLYCCYELLYGKVLLHNSGYFPSDLTDENAYQYELYRQLMVIGEISPNAALDICDIGCGQGHGSVFLLKHYLHKESCLTGLDIAEIAIKYCRWKHRKLKNAVFKLSQKGIPAKAEAFDVFLSVGSGVPHNSKLLQDVYRCLKPSGKFVFFEVYEASKEQALDQLIARNGFEITKKINVTPNLLLSLANDNERKQALLSRLWFLPKKAARFLHNYAATTGTDKFDACETEKLNGYIYVLRKLPDLILGNVDLWDGEYLKGWAFAFNHHLPVKLHIVVDGQVIAETIANQDRQDVASVYGKQRLNTGFSVALPLTANAREYSVRVIDSETNIEITTEDFMIGG